jgi:putative GTP pyrophosphokinase
MLSNSQIDRLGERLRTGTLGEEDLRHLDEYRRAAGGAYDEVINGIRRIGLSVTGRPSKSTRSIIEKLRRESCRLSQIQDIAGCRIVVGDSSEQMDVLPQIEDAFPGFVGIDRRLAPSHGYRAVHIIVRGLRVPVEIQLRTLLQHSCAEFSEKLADRYGSDVKYGGGSAEVRKILSSTSALVKQIEDQELELVALQRRNVPEEVKSVAAAMLAGQAKHRKELMETLNQFVEQHR